MGFQIVDKFNHGLMKRTAKFENVKTDTSAFRFSYKLSIWFLCIYAIAHVYITFSKTAIVCHANKPKEGLGNFIKKVEIFCWVHGTYSLHDSTFDGRRQLYPGIGGITSENDTVNYHHFYYKWTYIGILLVGLALYAPRYIWRNIENGRMKRLVGKLSNVVVVDGEMEKELERLAEYLKSHLGQHRSYALGLPICEALNLIVASGLRFMINYVTGYELGKFMDPSFLYTNSPPLERKDALVHIFPIFGKCTFEMFGYGGSIETHDFLCILLFNVVNQYAAVFFWYYFSFLIVVGTTQLAYRIVLIFSKRSRYYVLRNLMPLANPTDLSFVVNHIGYYDWFVLTQAGINLEPNVLRRAWILFVAKLRMEQHPAELQGELNLANSSPPLPTSMASTLPDSSRVPSDARSAHSSRQGPSQAVAVSPPVPTPRQGPPRAPTVSSSTARPHRQGRSRSTAV